MFFKKKVKKEIDFEAINDSWSMSTGTENGKPIILGIKQSLEQIIGNPIYPFRIGIAIPFLNPLENGMPTPEENLMFHKFEDEIMKSFAVVHRGFVCAIITGGGMKEYVSYSKSSEIKDIIDTLSDKFPKYKFTHYVAKDPRWAGYKQITKMVKK